jgi:hypothetical protein
MSQKRKLVAKGKPKGWFNNIERGDLYLKTPTMRTENFPLISKSADKLISYLVINTLIKKE